MSRALRLISHDPTTHIPMAGYLAGLVYLLTNKYEVSKMTYWVFIQALDGVTWNQNRMCNTVEEAKQYIEKQSKLWKSQGINRVYKVMYGNTECSLEMNKTNK